MIGCDFMLNKKGFTLVELLATIAILGILMGVAIGAVSWILDDSEENFYDNLEKNVLLTAETYFADHRAMLPQVVGQKRRISIRTLVNNNYLKKGDVVDYGKVECDLDQSYVYVTMESRGKFSYSLYLVCPAKTLGKDEEVSNTLNASVSIDGSTRVANLNISTTSSTVASYQYTIYKDSMMVYNSDGVEANHTTSFTGTIDLSAYVPGTIKVVVTVYDDYGNSKTVNTSAIMT